MWFVYFIVSVVLILVLGYFGEEGVNSLVCGVSNFLFWCVILFVVFILIALPIFLSGEDTGTIYKSKAVPYRSIRQDVNGDYFYLDESYDKRYPEIRIIADGETELKQYEYKQNNWFLDDILADYNREVLYLNLKDVK